MATDYVKNVGFYDAEQQDILRRRKIAEMMMQQGQTPLGPTENIGGWAVKRSPMEGIGKMAQALSGGYQQSQLDARSKALAERIRSERSQDYEKLMGAQMGQPEIAAPSPEAGGGPGRPAMAPTGINPALIAQLRSPEVQQLAAKQMMEMNKPMVLGRSLVTPTGQTLATDKTWQQEQESTRAARTTEAEARRQELVSRQQSDQAFRDQQARQAALDRAALARQTSADRAAMRPPRPETAPVVQTDSQGNVKFYDRAGNLIKDVGAVGKASAGVEKQRSAQKQLKTDLSRAISELETATKDGGLIDQSTGSGAGALVDVAGRFFGHSTPGAIAAGDMAPIFDLVLKMVPRFEGPQSDKDTASYERAAGQLANPAVPNAQKKAAGKEILRLMKARQAQFISKDMVGMEAEAGGAAPTNVDQLLDKYK